jgi:hypothetical protein
LTCFDLAPEVSPIFAILYFGFLKSRSSVVEAVAFPRLLDRRLSLSCSAHVSFVHAIHSNRLKLLCFLSFLLFNLLALPLAATETSSDKVRSLRNFTEIRKQVETLRGKKFLHEVPVFNVSQKELRTISDRDLQKDFPGAELHRYEELLAWLDVVPKGTDLKAAYANFFAEELAGLYDTDKKEMCIPFSTADTNSTRNTAEKKLQDIYSGVGDIVLAHEFTHALEDQYWPLDTPEDNDRSISTDRGTAHAFVSEGSANRQMIEAIPAQSVGDAPAPYFLLWNLLHSPAGECLVNNALKGSWKSSEALVEGVPETIARTEAMPYAFGYTFCTGIMRKWGLDGLDYVYEHPPISSEQVMHPTKYWEWRDFPVQIDLPDTLAPNWKQISIDSVGEAGVAILLGCRFQNLNLGLDLARGWDGDHVALFGNPAGGRLLLWASSWDSTNAAARFASACVRERQIAHKAPVTKSTGSRIEWQRPDGRAGVVERDGRYVILMETDRPEVLRSFENFCQEVSFTAPHEDAARAEANNPLRRFNPLWAWQKDRDYTITRSLCGLLSRHDRNSIGAADTFLLGVLAETRRTSSFRKWELGAGMIIRHESEARRGVSRTTLLPWGVLASHASARLPQSPDKTIARTSVLWGFGASASKSGAGLRSFNLLPFGLLLHKASGPNEDSFHIFASGLSHKTIGKRRTTRFRLLGIPIRTHTAAT